MLSADPTLPASPRSPTSPLAAASGGQEQQQQPPAAVSSQQAPKPVYDCVDVATQVRHPGRQPPAGIPRPRCLAAFPVLPPLPLGPHPPSCPLLSPRPQSLAVNLTLEEYRQTLLASAGLQQQLSTAPAGGGAGGAPVPAPAPAAPSTSLSHLTLTSADLESMGLCSHCRYPCYLRCRRQPGASLAAPHSPPAAST